MIVVFVLLLAISPLLLGTSVRLVEAALSLLPSRVFLHRCDLVGCQESTTRSSWSSHCVVVSRLVQVWFAAFTCQAQSLFQLLTRHSSLQDAMELFRVDIKW